MRVAVNSHALPVHEKNGIASLLCIFESTIELTFFLILSIIWVESKENVRLYTNNRICRLTSLRVVDL